jgi:glycosyltransferase involved in cell wall biosynthesis
LQKRGHVKCCGLTQRTKESAVVIGRKERPPSVPFNLASHCQHRGRPVGKYNCQCGGEPVAYECAKLNKLCIPHGIGKPGGNMLGKYILQLEFAVCSTCEHRKPVSDSVFERVNGKVNVGFIPCVFNDIGGIERWHETLLPNLGDDKIHVVGLASYSEFMGSPAILGCSIRSGEESVRSLMEACDVVVSWGTTKLPGVDKMPVVINVHHGDMIHEWSNSIAREADKFTDLHVTVHSQFQPEGTIRPAFHIANAINPDLLKPDPYWSLPAELKGKNLCLWQHRLAPEKRPEMLAVIAEELQEIDPSWRIVVVGDGPLKSSIDHPLIHYASVSHFPGRWLDEASCFISTAAHEGFGLACLEAMFFGVPVVATPTGICSDSSLCVQVPVDASAAEWAKAITGTKKDTDQVYLKVSQQYSLEKHVNAWRELIIKNTKSKSSE